MIRCTGPAPLPSPCLRPISLIDVSHGAAFDFAVHGAAMNTQGMGNHRHGLGVGETALNLISLCWVEVGVTHGMSS